MGPLPGKLGICADLSVPARLVMRLRIRGVPVRTSRQYRVNEASAEALFTWAWRRHCALLTLDRRYWDDTAHPIDRSPGLMLLEFPPGDLEQARHAFDMAYSIFADYFTPGDWKGVKVLASPRACTVKMAQPQGGAKEYTIQREAGLLFIEPRRAEAQRPADRGSASAVTAPAAST